MHWQASTLKRWRPLTNCERVSTTGHGACPAAMLHAALGTSIVHSKFLEIAYDEHESELVWLKHAIASVRTLCAAIHVSMT